MCWHKYDKIYTDIRSSPDLCLMYKDKKNSVGNATSIVLRNKEISKARQKICKQSLSLCRAEEIL